MMDGLTARAIREAHLITVIFPSDALMSERASPIFMSRKSDSHEDGVQKNFKREFLEKTQS